MARGCHGPVRFCLRCKFRRKEHAPETITLWFDPGCA
jgi:hypothetical protein